MKAAEVSRLLAGKCEEVCLHLFPNGSRKGHEFCVGSLSGDRGDSLKVRLEGEKAGVWSDFATGEKGDLIDLWRMSRQIPFMEAMTEIRAFLELPDPEKNIRSEKKDYKRPEGCGKPCYGAAFDYLKGRGILPETIRAMGIRSTDTAIIFPSHLPDGTLVLEKALKIERKNGKKETWVTPDSEPILFGWQALYPDARSVCLCEGEIDQMTLWQMGIPALSVPFGAGAGDKHRWIEREWDRLSGFDEIFLCFDSDEEGRKAVADLVPRLGRDRCRVVTLPEKDPNACLMKGIDMTPYFTNASHCDPEGLHRSDIYLSGALDILLGRSPDETGFPLPWCDNFKMLPHELTVWSGINGHGKSSMLNHLVVEFLNHGLPVLYCSHEMTPERLLVQMLRQITGGDGRHSGDRFEAIREMFLFNLFIYTGKTDRLEAIRYAIRRYGACHVVIDNLTRLCKMDDYSGQQKIVQDLSDIKDEFPVHIHLVTHSRKGESEKDRPDKQDVRGAGAISDIADNVVTIHRNKKKTEDLGKSDHELLISGKTRTAIRDEPDARLYVQKQRVDGWEGVIPLWYDPASCQFLGEPGEYPKIYDLSY